MREARPDLADAALAAAAAAVDLARLPLGLAARLPGVRLLARDGAFVRARMRSRAEGILTRALDTPEAHRILQRVAGQVADTIDADAVIAAVLRHEATQGVVGRALVTANGTPPLQRASRPPASRRQ